ncbi:SusC/RagA family TonB-linked outer membrane protein [uncultured Croceitalea sp.]|uniref:SusC/RagA family TonB-linked outer membrane protein n=1 Tax=uncultured Croceitalea sp. TaxID=1798908 RepID=UPI00374E55E8
MRTFIFLCCTVVFSFSPNDIFSQKEKIDIEQDMTITVDEVFEIIKSQTNYTFIYQEDLFKNAPLVHLTKGKIKINLLLEKSLSTESYQLNFDNVGTITVQTKPQLNTNTAQERVLSGKVTDESGIGLPGVNVIVKQRGVTTDIDGSYKITVKIGDVVSYSYLGFETQEITVASQLFVNIILKERTNELEEVVLVGYGVQRREEVTSAVSSVKSKDITKNSVGQVSFDRSLSGLIKGVNVNSNSGAPGSSIDINIRGFTSPFAGSDNNPLFVIDGVPFQARPTSLRNDETRFTQAQNPLLAINPNDIESIDVLKDAAATAIYGSRGANGVVIVNTKKGKKNTGPQVSWSSSVTMSDPIATQDYLSTSQWKDYLNVLFTNTSNAIETGAFNPFTLFTFANLGMINLTPGFLYDGLNEDFFGTENVDWNDVIYNTGYTQNYNLSIRGGSKSTSYSFSAGFTDQEAIVINDDFKQYSLRMAIDSKLSDVVEIGTNLNLGYNKRARGSGIGEFGEGGQNFRPDLPVFDEFGNPTRSPGLFFGFFPGVLPNPFASQLHKNNTRGYNVLGNTFLKVNLDKNFYVKADLNGSFLLTKSYLFEPKSIVGSDVPAFGRIADPSNSFGRDNESIVSNLTTDLTANYTNSFGKHNINVLLGYSWFRGADERTNSFLTGFPDDFILTNPSNATSSDISSSIIEQGLNSALGRISYNYDSKYFLTASIRRDASSRFGPEEQEGYFPSLSLGWNMAKENFLQDSDLINLMRLRASAGITGNNNLPDFGFLQGFAPGFRTAGTYAGQPAIGFRDQLANPSLSWEETKEVNLGLDFGLLKNRLRGSFDIYNRKTTGALLQTPIPFENGLQRFTSNFADLTNQGFEVEIGGDIVANDNWTWSLSANLSKNNNRVDRLSQIFSEDARRPYEVGEEINLIRGIKVLGIVQNQTEVDALNAAAPGGSYIDPSLGGVLLPGDYLYEDTNGDGVITFDDFTAIIGKTLPDFFGGINTKLRYKGLDLAAYFNFVSGGEVFLNNRPNLNSVTTNTIPSFNVENRWSPTNTDATLPQIIYRPNDFNNFPNSEQVADRSFIRLKNIQLGYNLPKTAISIWGLSNAYIFVSGSNLITWTNFPGLDPENSGLTNSSGTRDGIAGFGGSSYPNAKSWSFGINLNF